MKFIPSEIFHLQQSVVNSKVPISLISEQDTSLLFSLYNDDNINFRMVRENKCYSVIYFTYLGTEEEKKFEEFPHVSRLFNQWLNRLKTQNPFLFPINHYIEMVSPRYYIIKKEGLVIYTLGFEESSGMILRKALEILIKDFMLDQLPNSLHTHIKKNTIGVLFNTFYERDTLKVKDKFESEVEVLEEIKPFFHFVKETFSIGNDLSHYERRLEEFTASDMLKNLEKIEEHISEDLEQKRKTQDRILRERNFESYNVSKKL